MLLFIEYQLESGKYLPKFQNIVCYCLSLKSKLNLFTFKGFQNIVCYCLSFSNGNNHLLQKISKHRMLLFISSNAFCSSCNSDFKTSYVTVYHAFTKAFVVISSFQNIVCYCLSKTSEELSLITMNFKTSYVTVYQKEAPHFTFEYHLFQNIVCYCLSSIPDQKSSNKKNFKTSYVTVYRNL